MDIVLRESERLNTTIRSFLAYARPQRFQIARFDVRRALNDAALLLRNSAEVGEAHVIDVDVPPRASSGTRPTKGRSSRLSGTSPPTASARCPRAGGCASPPRLEPSSDGVVLTVQDEGIGIPAEELDSLFQPFHGRFAKGSGLGLAIVHRIVTRLQRRDSGQLAAGSRHDRVRPPAGARGGDDMSTVAAAPSSRSTDERPPRILVVDDERSMRELLAIVLRREGYEVLLAENGRAAIGLLEREPVDLLISDIKMPDLSGVDVLRAAKQIDPGHPRHHDHGVRLDRDRRRSDAAGRVRLPEQAVRHRSAQDEGAREDREPAAPAGERPAEADARPVAPVLEHHRAQRGDARRLQDDRDGRAHQQHDPADRRVGHGQGPRRAGDPFPLAAAREADGVAQLRRDAREPARVGALRPHARRVHRRRREQEGAARSRREGHDLPRRNRRDERRHAGQAAARAAGAAVPARRRARGAAGRHPRHRRDQPGSRRRRSRKGGSAKICSTASTSSRLRCRRCASAARTSRCSRSTSSSSTPSRWRRTITGMSREAMELLLQHDWPGNIRELENVIERAVALEATPAILPDSLPATIRGDAPQGRGRTGRGAARSGFDLEAHVQGDRARATSPRRCSEPAASR